MTTYDESLKCLLFARLNWKRDGTKLFRSVAAKPNYLFTSPVGKDTHLPHTDSDIRHRATLSLPLFLSPSICCAFSFFYPPLPSCFSHSSHLLFLTSLACRHTIFFTTYVSFTMLVTTRLPCLPNKNRDPPLARSCTAPSLTHFSASKMSKETI